MEHTDAKESQVRTSTNARTRSGNMVATREERRGVRGSYAQLFTVDAAAMPGCRSDERRVGEEITDGKYGKEGEVKIRGEDIAREQ